MNLIEIAKINSLQAYYLDNIPNQNKFKSNLGVEGLVVSQNKMHTISFAGTNEALDWIKVNLRFKRFEHKGFTKGYGSIRKKVFNIINNNNFLSQEFLLTGHSSGGAIATLFAQDLAEYCTTHLITFGCPKVENLDLNKLSKLKTHIRFVNPLDLVTYLPLNVEHYGNKNIVWWWGNPHSMNGYWAKSK